MRKNYGPLMLFSAFILFTLAQQVFFVVPQGKQAIVEQFGAFRRAVTEPGLHVKLPFLQQVAYFDIRTLNWDGRPEDFTTRDRQAIIVESAARFRISDLRLFRNMVREQNEIDRRINRPITSAIGRIISENNLVELVKNTRGETKVSAIAASATGMIPAGSGSSAVEQAGIVTAVMKGRDALSEEIKAALETEFKTLGMEIMDFQLVRVSYSPTVEARVFERMKAEQNSLAENILSEGRTSKERILGTQNQEVMELEAQAMREASAIVSQAQAEAMQILAKAVGPQADLYTFVRTLDAYRNSFKEDTTMLLSSDDEFLKIFQSGKVGGTP